MATNYNLPLEQAYQSPLFDKEKLRSTLPANVIESYPKFYKFLKAYFEFLEQDTETVGRIKALKNAREPNLSDFKSSLLNEFGENFPNITTISNDVLLKILNIFYISKGNEESIEAYFRLFLNDTTVSVEYPKDNMLRLDDGIWDDTNNVYTSNQGHLDETFMVIQDDLKYQIYSYIIKSGQNVKDWGTTYKEAVHPLGWLFFGEVELNGFAAFRVGSYSPLFVPGMQAFAAPALELTAAATHNEIGIAQQFERIMNPMAAMDYDSLDLGLNIIASQSVTINDIKDFTIEQLSTLAVATTIRRGAMIEIT